MGNRWVAVLDSIIQPLHAATCAGDYRLGWDSDNIIIIKISE